MKIEAYIKADLNAGKASKSIDASTLCYTTVEAEIKGVSYGISPIKNGRNNMSTGELTLETTDNKCIIIKCWNIDDDMADDEFDYRQWSKFDDVIDNRGQQPTPPPQTDYNIAPDNRNIAAIVLILVTSVIWGPLLIGLLAGAFGLTVGLAAGIFAIGCSGLGLIVAGGVTAFQAPPVGVLLIGVGLFLTGLGVLIFVPFCKLVIGLFKKFFGWLTRSLRTIFNNVKNNKAVSENG